MNDFGSVCFEINDSFSTVDFPKVIEVRLNIGLGRSKSNGEVGAICGKFSTKRWLGELGFDDSNLGDLISDVDFVGETTDLIGEDIWEVNSFGSSMN